jgi:hypothetical protein
MQMLVKMTLHQTRLAIKNHFPSRHFQAVPLFAIRSFHGRAPAKAAALEWPDAIVRLVF